MLPEYAFINENGQLQNIKNLVATSQRKTYVIVATKDTLALIGRGEESKHNLEKHQTEELLGRNSSGSGQENREYDRGDPLR
jgi:hypothetical protein